MGKVLWVVLGIPLGIVLVALGVANREPLTVSLDPFSATNPVLAIHPPVFIAFFVALAAGVLIGGVAVWFSHMKVRRALNRSRLEANRLRQELDKLMADRAAAVGSAGGSTLPAIGGPRRVA